MCKFFINFIKIFKRLWEYIFAECHPTEPKFWGFCIGPPPFFFSPYAHGCRNNFKKEKMSISTLFRGQYAFCDLLYAFSFCPDLMSVRWEKKLGGGPIKKPQNFGSFRGTFSKNVLLNTFEKFYEVYKQFAQKFKNFSKIFKIKNNRI